MNNFPQISQTARKLILETNVRTSTPHLSSSLSVVDILLALGISDEKSGQKREIYLSKGHAALAIYCAYVALGKLPADSLESYCADGSVFEGHVNSRIPGVPLSTGSLGHASPFAIGRAIGDLISGGRFQHWVVLSDGELDEGSNWESFLIAAHRKLPNFHVIVDRNRLQSLTTTEETSALEPLAAKLGAFGFFVAQVDGHDHIALSEQIVQAEKIGRPSAIIANTVKGKGVKDIELHPTLYHYKSATNEHLSAFQEGKA